MHAKLKGMDTPAQRLGGLVQERREAMGIYTVVDAASRSGLSRETWAKVERGDPAAPVTYRKVEALLQWEPGSCGAVLAGGDPTPIAARTAGTRHLSTTEVDELRELRANVAAALEHVDRLLRESG